MNLANLAAQQTGARAQTPEVAETGAKSAAESKPAFAVFSSGPQPNFGVGPYKFERGRLVLPAEEAEEFRKLLATIDPISRNAVRELSGAEAESAEVAEPVATRANDSTLGGMVLVPAGTVLQAPMPQTMAGAGESTQENQ